MKIVLDNNVFISGIFWKGFPNQIIKLAEERKIEIIITQEIIDELFGVLKRKKFRPLFLEAKIEHNEVFEKILELVTTYSATDKIEIIKEDPDDNKFLSCAMAGGASFIVSGDKHLLNLKSFQGIPILTPRQFIDRFKKL